MQSIARKAGAVFSIVLLIGLFLYHDAFARGGGGGSGGGGGGGGGGSMSGGAGVIPAPVAIFFNIIILIVIVFGVIFVWYKRRKRIEVAKVTMQAAALQDASWDRDEVMARIRDVFMRFQGDWSALLHEPMREYLTDRYYRRMVLELNVLQNEGRRNDVANPEIFDMTVLDVTDDANDSKDTFTVEIKARADDALLDTRNEKTLFVDRSLFTEYWTFVREDGVWKLDLIRQGTENMMLKDKDIEAFSLRNGFFYDPDFGWLMMPDKGVIFRKTSFKNSDINNHVIGFFRGKIVEFYTYIPNTNATAGFVVAQAVIPKSYRDILVRRKSGWSVFAPSGLRRVGTESIAFDNRFEIFADPQDQVSSLELLAPDFMERIFNLPFELNIEVVGNFLYLYAKSQKNIRYDDMLEILSRAFDEMER